METNQQKTWCIYKHTNKLNGKIYIGQTCKPLKERWRNGEGYKGCSYFYRAIQKYGWENFDHEILKTNLTSEEANQAEIYFIEHYNSTNSEFGYNIRSGGWNSPLAEETKEILREKATGRLHSQETKNKLSRDRTGEGNPKWGLHEPQKVRMKRSRPVLCVETGTIYYGVREASRETGLYDNMIVKCCKGKRETYNGVHWQYWEEDFKETPKVVLPKYLKGTAKPVKCIETGVMYNSAVEASQETKIDSSTISTCCKYPNKTAGGYHWSCALEEYNENFKKKLQANIDKAYKEWNELHKED